MFDMVCAERFESASTLPTSPNASGAKEIGINSATVEIDRCLTIEVQPKHSVKRSLSSLMKSAASCGLSSSTIPPSLPVSSLLESLPLLTDVLLFLLLSRALRSPFRSTRLSGFHISICRAVVETLARVVLMCEIGTCPVRAAAYA